MYFENVHFRIDNVASSRRFVWNNAEALKRDGLLRLLL